MANVCAGVEIGGSIAECLLPRPVLVDACWRLARRIDRDDGELNEQVRHRLVRSVADEFLERRDRPVGAECVDGCCDSFDLDLIHFTKTNPLRILALLIERFGFGVGKNEGNRTKPLLVIK